MFQITVTCRCALLRRTILLGRMCYFSGSLCWFHLCCLFRLPDPPLCQMLYYSQFFQAGVLHGLYKVCSKHSCTMFEMYHCCLTRYAHEYKRSLPLFWGCPINQYRCACRKVSQFLDCFPVHWASGWPSTNAIMFPVCILSDTSIPISIAFACFICIAAGIFSSSRCIVTNTSNTGQSS